MSSRRSGYGLLLPSATAIPVSIEILEAAQARQLQAELNLASFNASTMLNQPDSFGVLSGCVESDHAYQEQFMSFAGTLMGQGHVTRDNTLETVRKLCDVWENEE